MSDAGSLELEKLRIKINEAVRYSQRYWTIYKENTFGVATIINLIYKKSYVEVLFFTNKHVKEFGVPLLKINTPVETSVDFNEIILDPDFDEDGFVNPAKIIERLNLTIEKEIQHHLSDLNKELQLIDEKYENYPLEDNYYSREIRIYFPEFALKLEIDFQNYPLVPILTFSRTLNKIVTKKDFLDLAIIKNWNEANPLHIVEVVGVIVDIVVDRLKLEPLKEVSQHLVLKEVSITKEIQNLSFNIHKGKSIGIVYEKEQLSDKLSLIKLFETISGTQSEFSGEIKIFGIEIQQLEEKERKRIFILPEAIDSKIVNMRVKKAIQYHINVKPPWKIGKRALDKWLKKAGLFQLKDELVEEILSAAPKKRRKKYYIEAALEATGLLNKKDRKFSQLRPLEYLLFLIARALLQSPTIIMFLLPKGLLGRLEFEKFSDYVEKIKKIFHIVLIFYGPKEIVSKCDQILTITEKGTEIGTISELIEKMPQSGEILAIELNRAVEEEIKKMLDLKSAIFKEERKNEKFKIFLKEDPDNMLIQLMEIFGKKLYNFKRFKATLSDYLEFLELR